MKAPESNKDDAGSPLKRMDARRKDEGGLEDEQDAGEAASYGVAAVAERFERCCAAGIAAVPQPEKTARDSTTYSTSARTKAVKEREVERKAKLLKDGVQQSREASAASRKEFYSDFNGSRREDWRDWVGSIAEAMQTAYKAGDRTEMARQHKRMTRGKTSVRGEPKLDDEGNRMKDTNDVLKWWHKGMTDHWKATDAEDGRPELVELVQAMRESKVDLSTGRLDKTMKRLRLKKATGDDDIPTEFFEAVEEAREDLYELVRLIFQDEDIPASMVVIIFAMIYKGPKKGSVNVFGSYRPIGLIRHAFKLVDAVFQEELAIDTELFLSPAQEGFRALRGAPGNILRTRLFVTVVGAIGMEGLLTLLDYSGAFDATSHKFIDTVLGKAGARRKLRELHRKVRAVTQGKVRVRGPDGTLSLSDPFQILRGGAQGGLSVPWVFNCCLSDILEEDDSNRGDLDYAIRRDCLRLECFHSGGERWYAGGADDGSGATTAAGTTTGPAAETQLDEGEIRWNAAVKTGGKALYDARAKARKLLEDEAQEVAKRGMRKARWIKDDEPEAEPDPNTHETNAERRTRADWVKYNEAEAAKRKAEAQEDSKPARERLQLLHEVRLPDGAVSRCKICDAAIPYVGFCADCTGLRLEVPAKDYWKTLRAAAGEGDDSLDSVGDASDSAESGAPEQRRSSRLQTDTDAPDYKDKSSSSEDDDPISQRNSTRAAVSVRSGRAQQARRGTRGIRKRVPRGVLRLAGMRLDYADDIMVTEADDDLQAAIDESSRVVTGIAKRSRELADQNMAPSKCMCLLLRSAEAVGATTRADVLALGLTHQCECGEPWGSKWGLDAHRRSCRVANAVPELDDDGDVNHDVAELLDTRGKRGERKWRVKWKGTNPDGSDRWPDLGTGNGTTEFGWIAEEDLSITDEMIAMRQAYWRNNRHQDQREANELDGENRCSWCNRMYASAAYLAGHRKRVGKKVCPMKPIVRSYKNTDVDRMVQRKKREELLKSVPKCNLEGVELKYKIQAEYLGTMWQGDGGCDVDVNRRTAMARQTYNQLWWFWGDSKFARSLKLQIFEANVLSRVIWGAEGWLLTDKILQKLNGWCSRCLAPITGQTQHVEASERKQTMSMTGMIRHRRLVYVGHVLRDDPGSLTRRMLLRYAELERRGVVNEPGDILMDAPATTSNGMLVEMAGGFGTAENREIRRAQWSEWCKRRLPAFDRKREIQKEDLLRQVRASVTANTAEETAAALRNIKHSWRIYSDGGCDGNGAKGKWGKSGYGAVIYACRDDGTVIEVANLYGPVVTDVSSEWFMGATRGTNQTGELCGVVAALLWMLTHVFDEDDVVICVDSLYAGNQLEGFWRVNCNKDLIDLGKDLLRQVREKRTVTFVHVKGHSEDGGNDRADLLV